MRVRVGTSGFAYKEWKGRFYPPVVAESDLLTIYARTFSTVEINNTFYRMPSRAVLESWSSSVPARFVFSIKASRRITHQKRLKDPAENLQYLYGNTAVLGAQLGALLFQLPPNLSQDLDRLRHFLQSRPDPRRVAIEFRHPTWFDEATFELLREHAVACCIADDEEGSTRFVATAPFGYLRLRKETYSEAELDDLARQVRAQPWDDAFVFFSHEEGSPAMAQAFASRFAGETESAYKWAPRAADPRKKEERKGTG